MWRKRCGWMRRKPANDGVVVSQACDDSLDQGGLPSLLNAHQRANLMSPTAFLPHECVVCCLSALVNRWFTSFCK